jgi:hypothetical protein
VSRRRRRLAQGLAALAGGLVVRAVTDPGAARRSLAVGITRQRERSEPGGAATRAAEVFAKISFDLVP